MSDGDLQSLCPLPAPSEADAPTLIQLLAAPAAPASRPGAVWSIITYLRHIKPISNTVPASGEPPDHWASVVATLAPYPSSPFPTTNEVRPR